MKIDYKILSIILISIIVVLLILNNKKPDNVDNIQQPIIDSLNLIKTINLKTIDSLLILNKKIEKEFLEKPSKIIYIQKKNEESHNHIDTLSDYKTDSLFWANLKEYKQLRERFSINRFN